MKNFFFIKNLINIGIFLHFCLNIAATCGFLYISRLNYPGASALIRLHELENKDFRNFNGYFLKFEIYFVFFLFSFKLSMFTWII
jgi:hypothetical protein